MAIVGAGGIGFDVAEFLVQDGVSPTEDLDLWRREWGVGDPAETPGGLAEAGPRPEAPARSVTLLQRKKTKPGKGLGKTTGWIHRMSLAAKDVRMLAGVTYEEITSEGIWISDGDGERRLIEADNVVLCSGQEPNRALADALAAREIRAHLDRRGGRGERAGRQAGHRPGEPAGGGTLGRNRRRISAGFA